MSFTAGPSSDGFLTSTAPGPSRPSGNYLHPAPRRSASDEEDQGADAGRTGHQVPLVPHGHPGLPPNVNMNLYNKVPRAVTLSSMSNNGMSFGASAWTGKSTARRLDFLRMGKAKVVYLVINALYTFAAIALVFLMGFTWSNFYALAPLVRILYPTAVILATVTAPLLLATGIIGFFGALTHSKTWMTVSVMTSTLGLAGCVFVGYYSYRFINTSRWDPGLSSMWDGYNAHSRGTIQSKLGCCGFLSAADRPEFDGVQCNQTSPFTRAPGVPVVPGLSPASIPSSFAYTGTFAIDRRQAASDSTATDTAAPDTTTEAPTATAAPGAPAPPLQPLPLTTAPSVTFPALTAAPVVTPTPSVDPLTDLPVNSPGCYNNFSDFGVSTMRLFYITAFCFLPLGTMQFVAGILAANHIYD
ncbi:hypothetical protein HK101_010552 [Irineochytrium annulatum]|nr:hypothetical protein HK101_010552 [Irineochytrium annulatum]